MADLDYGKDHRLSGSSLKSLRPSGNDGQVSADLPYRGGLEGQKPRLL